MQPRYASNSSEAGDERETWSSSSVAIPPITGFHSQIHPPHHHHFHGPPVGSASPQPTGPSPVQNPTRDPHLHYHPKYRSSSEWKKLNDNSPHCHLPLNDNEKLSPCKTLGIDLYEVEDSQLGTHIANSCARGHSAGIPDLPPFQRRCIHALADIIASPYTLGLPAQIGVFLRPDRTRRSAFNKQLSTYLKIAYRRLGRKPKNLYQKWDILATLLPTLFVLLFSYFCGLIFGWQLGQTIGLTSIILYVLFLCIVLYGGLKKRWKFIQPVAETLLRYARSWRLIVDIIFYKPQKQTTIPSNIRLLPVSLKLGVSESSWDAALRLSEKMWQSATSKYSKTTVYLQYASEDGDCAVERRCRKSCCLPAWICAFLGVISLPTLFTALQIYTNLGNNTAQYKLGSKVAFIIAAFVETIAVVSLAVTAYKPIIRLAKVKSRFQVLKKKKTRLLLSRQKSKGDKKISLLSADDDLMDDRSSSSTDSMTGRINHSHSIQTPKKLTSPKKSQDYLLRNGFDGLDKAESIDAQLESKLREEAMATCHTLHRLDARNNRQTRFLLSIDATAISVNLATAPQRLAEFSGLLNRLFTSSPQGESGVLWSLDNARELAESPDSVHSKRFKESLPNVPNVIILLVCRQNMSPPCDSGPESPPICDFWQNALDACHLTVFIDEPVEGPPQTPGGNNSNVGSRHLAKSSHCIDSSCPPDVWPSFLSFPDFFVEEHPLADINLSKLKHLLIHMAFLGRMLKAGENRSNWSNLLEVATTWLCLLVHWPFHSAWLSLFLEEHYLSGGAGQTVRQRIRIPGIIGSGGDSSDDDDDDDDENTASTTSQPVLPEDTLPMLYSRVLERLAPALSACRSRGGTLSSQVQSPASHSSSGGLQNTGGGFQTSAALRLSELASRDCGPARLAALLRYRSRASNVNPAINAARPNILVRHLVAVMASSPLMNPKTRARIQAFLNRRGFSLIRSSSRDLQAHRSLQSLRDREPELLPISINPPKTIRPCPVRLKNGIPRKPLSKMTVDDVCHLVDDMIDLYSNHCPHRPRTNSESTSDTPNDDNRRQTTPQSISRSTSIAAYFLRLRALNISGAVLTVCSLNESLRREIGMTFGDWQLFTNLINHLKMVESENIPNPPTPQHNCQCARSMGDLASIHHTHWHHAHPTQNGSSKPNRNTWTSESILGATRWRYGNDSSPSPIIDGSSASSSIVSGSCTSADPNWRSHALSNQEETCHLSGGSCSVYSAELSCSISSSEDTIPSNASSPSLSSLHSSTLHDESLSQDKTPNKNWRYDVNV